MKREFEKWLSDFAKGKAVNRIDILEEAFKAGCEYGIESAISHIKEPDHDAEVLGFPNGEAPTESSKLWKKVNSKL